MTPLNPASILYELDAAIRRERYLMRHPFRNLEIMALAEEKSILQQNVHWPTPEQLDRKDVATLRHIEASIYCQKDLPMQTMQSYVDSNWEAIRDAAIRFINT